MRKNKAKNKIVNEDGSYVVQNNRKLNIFAFILCVFASFFVWIYVMNTQNSDYTKTFSISAEIINEEKLLDETGFSIFGVPERQISVTIQGKKQDIKKYSEKDFRAYVDVSVINEAGPTSVTVSVETPTTAVKVISVEPKTIAFYADRLVTREIDVKGCFDNTESCGFPVTPAKITVSGPETYLNKIDHAHAVIPYDSEGHQISTTDIRLYDANKQQLSSLYMTVEQETVTVTIEQVNDEK